MRAAIAAVSFSFAILLSLFSVAGAVPQATPLPAQLSDAEFWRVFTDFSEPGGDYQYENFVSNEDTIQDVIPVLAKVTKPGGIYLGVGPEQNFTYAAAVKAKMAFVFDIRRQNAIELLMYKALFELSPTRGDFVSRLFSIKSPDKVPATARANGVFLAFDGLKGARDYYAQNLADIKANLSRHGFALAAIDLQKIDYVYDVFFRAGPQINYAFASASPGGAPTPSYVDLMTDTDDDKKAWSFLATEENYQFVREMQLKNLFIPIVGDFSGPKAIRSVADYLKRHSATVSTFYISNVEVYLNSPARGGTPEKLQVFYENAAALPVDSSSVFIRFVGAGGASANLSWWKKNTWLSVVSPMSDLSNRIKAGGKPTYAEVLQAIADPKTLVTPSQQRP